MGTPQNCILSNSNPSIVCQGQEVTPNNGHKEEGIMGNKEEFMGVLDVFIHDATNIHNICIYQKQDVYAKIFLTNNPESTESTQIINGGGQNPVFNENLKINVPKGDSSLRCEIWMLSRIKNYLEDQLLGFTLIPLSEILIENGKLEKEFQLSTSDLLHSPSGFVKLSIKYIGSSPDVFEITKPQSCVRDQDSQVSFELEKIEFPDPKVVNENEIMVSEYYSTTCTEIESLSVVSSGQSQTTENDDSLSSDSNDHFVSRFPKENLEISEKQEEKKEEKMVAKKVDVCVKDEFEQKVVQQEIVDMYLKSMNQFTEALAKMNLPMDKGHESPDSGVHDVNVQDSNGKGSKGSKGEGANPKVFYGSRAFF